MTWFLRSRNEGGEKGCMAKEEGEGGKEKRL
jgi:hypothetical protein